MRVERQQDLGPDPLKTKIQAIGAWDLDTVPSVSIAHGLTAADIREVSVIIKKDDVAEYYPIDFSIGAAAVCGSVYITATDIVLSSVTGGGFDSINYNDIAINRGWIVIKYV